MATREELRRESGFLVLGILMGAILGITSDIWTHYFLKWYDSLPHAQWAEPLLLISLTIITIAFFAYLLWWSINQIKRGTAQTPKAA